MSGEYDDTPELGFLLTRLSVVLAGAHAAGREVEDCYGDLIRGARAGEGGDRHAQRGAASATPSHPSPGASLQELDRLVQLLDNLARFTAALAPEVPEGLRISAAAARGQILLRDLAQALLGRPGTTAVIWAGDGGAGAPGASPGIAAGAEPEDGLHLF